MMPRPALALLPLLTALAGPAAAQERPLDLRLPTANQHLFTGRPEQFFMYVDRTFEGERSRPWQGGAYGFVRDPVRTGKGVVYTRFHEGIDIAPVKRDRAGNPVDLVNSVAAGTVVYVNPVSGRSNYGKYVVVEHRLPGGPFYSLYAHLADVICRPGDPVRAGGALGRMGFTGAGITRVRAHVHLEFGLLLNSRFDDWHSAFAGGTNHHGIHNGMNIAGLDVSRLFIEHRRNPALSIPQFVQKTPVHFRVTVPREGVPEIAGRYPWLLQGNPSLPSPSWIISFGNTGLPVSIHPGNERVDGPVVSAVRASEVPHWMLTRKLLSGSGSTATLGRSGKSLLALITGDFPSADQRTSSTGPH